MKLNQFESSISFIHNSLPGYLRKLYEKFLVIENELYAQLERAYNSNPYSVNKYIKAIIPGDPQFIQIFKYIMSIENQVILQSYIENINQEIDYHDSGMDDAFETIVGADIVAPLNKLKIFISSFPYRYGYSIKENLPIMCMEPEVPHYPPSINYNTGDKGFISSTTLYNENGNLSLFNGLTSVLKIDINHVFTFYFHELFRVLANSDRVPNDIPAFELYRSFHNDLNNPDETIAKSIEDKLMPYWNAVEGSAILSYMIYAGKLLGAKKDMVQWLYTTFVKGTVSDIEKGEFFKTADITAFSGHQIKNVANDGISGDPLVDNNLVDKYEIDQEKTIFKQIPAKNVKWNPSILYKYLRLNYSNWCTVINVIANINKSNDSQNISTDDMYNKPSEFVFARNTDIENHISVARYILSEYISHYFATYNVYVFPAGKNLAIGSFFIQFVSNRIFNAEVKSIISSSCLNIFDYKCKCIEKFCSHPRSIIDYFVNSVDAIGILHAIKMVKNILADIFMTYSYIIILNGVYNNQDRILDEKDDLTGRSKKELFLEIYYSLIKRLQNVLERDIAWCYRDIVICDGNRINNTEWFKGVCGELDEYIKSIYTPLEAYINRDNIPVLNDIQNIRNVLKNISTPLTFNNTEYNHFIRDLDNSIKDFTIYTFLITELYDIHPISVMAELSQYYKSRNSGRLEQNQLTINRLIAGGFTRSGNLFPQNRITTELLNKVRLYTPKLFTSLESIDDMITQAKEDAILGNNANYSFIGGLGGTVTSEEDIVDQLIPPDSPGDNSIQFNNGVEGFSQADRIMIHKDTVTSMVNHWNELFKIAVLGGKEMVIPG